MRLKLLLFALFKREKGFNVALFLKKLTKALFGKVNFTHSCSFKVYEDLHMAFVINTLPLLLMPPFGPSFMIVIDDTS
jgi:hypothetical protein